MKTLDRIEPTQIRPTRVLCVRCVHARRRTWWGAPLPPGKYRCAHPVTREPRALIAADREDIRPSARTKLGVVGDVKDPEFRWPWEFSPRFLVACRGFEY